MVSCSFLEIGLFLFILYTIPNFRSSMSLGSFIAFTTIPTKLILYASISTEKI